MKKTKLLFFLLLIGSFFHLQAQQGVVPSQDPVDKLGELTPGNTGTSNNMSLGTRDVTFTLCGTSATQTFTIWERSGLQYNLTVVSRDATLTSSMSFVLTSASGGNKTFTNEGTGGWVTTGCGAGPHWHNPTTVTVSGQGKIVYELRNNANSNVTKITVTLDPVESVYADDVKATLPPTSYYENGAAFPAVSLLTEIGERSTVIWTANAKAGSTPVSLPQGFSIVDSLGMNAYIPAVPSLHNPYNEPMTITLTALLTGCPTTNTTTVPFEIVIGNNVAEDNTLVASSDNLIDGICGIGSFSTFTFTTKKNGSTIPSGVTYEAVFVSGDNILDLSSDQPGSDGTWTPVSVKTGKGVYQVTPVYQNLRGVPVILSLESSDPLNSSMVNASGNLAYENGDIVPSVDLGAHIPANAILTWTATGDDIGLPTSGNAVVPSFKAVNTTNAIKQATISYTLEYTSGACAGDKITGSFTISVSPKIINDPSLTITLDSNSQTICEGSLFDPIALQARYHHGDEDQFVDNSEVKYYISYISGDHILSGSAGYITSPWTPTASSTGTGVYQIVPFHNNNQGTPATVTFTVLPELIASHLVNAPCALTNCFAFS